MPVPKTTRWPLKLHSKAKHEILRRYLGAWFGILGRYNQRLNYLDGFCGPGRYDKGEEGSPIIALKIALGHNANQIIREANFVFIDEKEDRIAHLEYEINCLPIPKNFDIVTVVDQFENTLKGILDDLDAKGGKLAPTFAFIDPFGFKGVPFQLIQRLLSNPKTEIFINIQVESINRWLNHPSPQITDQIKELFGTNKVLDVLLSGGDRVCELRNLYQKQLEMCAKFVRYFEMRDENNRTIYYLFFATNNSLGHAKMKAAFWQVDSTTGFRFSDATNPDQPVLFEEDPTLELREELVNHFAGRRVYVKLIKNYVEDCTPFIESHMKKVLRKLEEQGRIQVELYKSDGKRRVALSFTDEVIVTFLSPL